MSASLLTTKLYVPPVSTSVVARPRLFELLDEGLLQKLTVLSAPAGFGKTTLLSDWIRARKLPVAWISLDAGDNDPMRFLSYLIAALQKAHRDTGQIAQALLQSHPAPPIESALTTLINEIAEIPNDLILALDDYHIIEAQTIHRAMTFFLDYLPPPIHVFICTRADPPLPLARLRARGQMTEIRALELRFGLEEVDAYLNHVMSLNLPPEDVAALDTRTEGWIAGLQMAAVSMRGKQDRTSFIREFTGSHRFILDYLAEEVLQQRSEQIRTFLLQTSILERLTAPLCDAVTQEQGVEQTLEELERANLFVVPLDDQRRWYRYHRLFSDILRHQLQRIYPDLVSELHCRAARWFEQDGDVSEAIKHFSTAKAYDDATRLIEANGMATLNRGQMVDVLGWMELIPEPYFRKRPWLSIYHAWVLLLTGQVKDMEPRVVAAEQALSTISFTDAEARGVLGHIAAIRAYAAALRGDAGEATRLAEEAQRQLPEDAHSVRSVVAFTHAGASIMAEDLQAAEVAFSRAARLSQEVGNIHVSVPALVSLANLRAIHGELHHAASIYREAIALAVHPNGQPLPIAAGAYAGLGNLLYEWNDLGAARGHVERGLDLARLWGNADSITAGHVALARLRQAQGERDAARGLLEETARVAQGTALTPLTVALLSAQRIRSLLVVGDVESAARASRERGLSVDEEIGFLRESEYIAFARVLVAEGRRPDALKLLARLLISAAGAGRRSRVIELYVLQALALQAEGEFAMALASIGMALSIAEPEGYTRVFLDEGAPMVDLLRRAGSRGIVPKYVARLLSFETDVVSTTSQPLIEPLSEREIEVLGLIASGLSNQDIAEKLVLSVGTVKAHTSSIYRKLDVASRTEAVARARDLKLI